MKILRKWLGITKLQEDYDRLIIEHRRLHTFCEQDVANISDFKDMIIQIVKANFPKNVSSLELPSGIKIEKLILPHWMDERMEEINKAKKK